MGTEGAAIATGLGYSVTTVVGCIIFCNKKNLLHFTRPHFSFDVLKKQFPMVAQKWQPPLLPESQH